MVETIMLDLEITFRSGRILKTVVSKTELDWMYDKMFGREEGNFANFDGTVVNISEIEYVQFHEIESEEQNDY